MISTHNRYYFNWGKRQPQEVLNAVFSPYLKTNSSPFFRKDEMNYG